MADAGVKIRCEIDGALVHVVSTHLKKNHPDWTLERYRETYPDAPIMSEAAKRLAKKQLEEKKAAVAAEISGVSFEMKPMGEIFGLGSVAAVKNGRGEPIAIKVFSHEAPEDLLLVPDIDDGYVFNVDLTKSQLMALEMGMTSYYWGPHGTGKTTSIEQVCARTGRPFMRVQHTANTEESHIIGQYVVEDGSTSFQLGPLAIAMMNGYVYCADEYDFAMPNVTAVYQPVMEGKPLYIKEAPISMRLIRPHPNFRFVATGNTNGSGDETGLYQGTTVQNAANYSRFTITEEVGYMDPKVERAVVQAKSRIDADTAQKLVSFAKMIRESFAGGNISMPISPRELISAGKIGVFHRDFKVGLDKSFTNRLSRTDKAVAQQAAQRVFG